LYPALKGAPRVAGGSSDDALWPMVAI